MSSREQPCALCRGSGKLRQSHVLPAFVFRWLRGTSATGHIRFAEAPNRRVQDGLKLRWLCGDCEGLLGENETLFATQLFHPFNADQTVKVPYGPWLLRFCASVSWRVLRYSVDHIPLTNFTQDQLQLAHEALGAWEDVIFGRKPHPGQFEQHLLPLAGLASSTVPGMPENINRYLLRAVEFDVPTTSTQAFTYAKLGRFALFGFIRSTERWRGSRVAANHGMIMPREFHLPSTVLGFLQYRARRNAEIVEGISESQHRKIEDEVLNNPERFARSETYAAMLEDERLFGTQAIIRRPKAENR